MEDKQNIELEDNQLVLKNLLIDKADEEDNASSSTKDNKKCDESKSTANSSQKEQERCETKTPTPARTSPEPSCAICLEQLQNKSFTDSCFHMFCFTCLVEWSKVKPECPLCKQSFKSIVHNVRSFEDYDQYYIRSRSSDNMLSYCGERRFQYRTTMTPERMLERNHIQYPDSLQSEIASHRMRYAPHSIQMYATAQIERRLPCNFRRRVYDQNLWVQPLSSGRIRCATPQFFRSNIACTHRLLPWLNRELFALMQNNEGQVSFVIELIMALIVRFEITSQEFFLHIDPYLAPNTSHFVHEFYNFAISPYSMELYDTNAKYNMPFETVRVVSSPDSDVIPLPTTNESTSKKSTSINRRKRHHSRKKHLKEFKRLKKIILKRNSEKNCWETVASGQVVHFNELDPHSFEVAGPSTYRQAEIPGCSTSSSNQDLDRSNDVEFFDEECQIVGYVKPRSERTPEIVDISSGDEAENIVNVPSDDDDDTMFSPPTLSDNPQIVANSSSGLQGNSSVGNLQGNSSVGNLQGNSSVGDLQGNSSVGDLQANLVVSDDDIIFIGETIKKNEASDKPIDYSLKKPDVDSGHEEDFHSPSCSRDNTEYELLQLRKSSSLIQSAVRTLSNENEAGSSSWSPVSKPKKRRAAFLDDSSTESCSESAQVTELDSRIKKLKLRSVVAHFSFDPSDERNDSSRHSSSHKKHKEKKKKKKKHKRKHRIYSSDSN